MKHSIFAALSSAHNLQHLRWFASVPAHEFLQSFISHEAIGYKKGIGTDTVHGFDMSHMNRLLAAFDNPQSQWPAVHIAGTKGKGSTAAMLSNIFTAAKYKAGMYTSPHITSLRERICVNNTPISESEFEELVDAHHDSINAVNDELGGKLSQFEIMTALAYRHFADQQVDVGVIECGLGGSRDATNVFTSEQLKLSIVTTIGLEHKEALGGGIDTIALAKAGILKHGTPVVLARQPEAVADFMVRQKAYDLDCPIVDAANEVVAHAKGTKEEEGQLYEHCTLGFVGKVYDRMAGPQVTTYDVKLPLVGVHQVENAQVAAAAALQLQAMGFDRISPEAIVKGLESARLPGRFQAQRLQEEGQNDYHWLVLDGAHTPLSAQALAATLRRAFPHKPLALIIAMANDKDHKGVVTVLQDMCPQVVVFTTCPIAGSTQRQAAPGVIAAHWQAVAMSKTGPAARVRSRQLIQASLTAAIEKARMELNASGGDGVICVCGSMYAVAEALRCMPAVAAQSGGVVGEAGKETLEAGVAAAAAH